MGEKVNPVSTLGRGTARDSGGGGIMPLQPGDPVTSLICLATVCDSDREREEPI